MRLLLVIAAALLLLPFAQAHGAASPRHQDTRLLHDHNDDCGGDGVTSNCRGTIDLIALDVQEFNDGTDKVAFRFTLDRGQSGSHKLTLTYDAPSGKKTLETTTTDQATFTGGFDKLTVSTANDGTRYILEAQVASGKAGVIEGQKLSNFRVEARRDNTLGDFMPGGYQGVLGPVPDPAQGDGPTNYVKPDYAGRGAGYYVSLTAANAAGQNTATASFEVRNLLDVAQTVTLRIAAEAADAKFAGGSQEKTVDLSRKGTQSIKVEVAGSGDGQFTLTATTSLGGKTIRSGSYSISSPSTQPTTGPDDDPEPTMEPAPDGNGGEEESKGAPTLPLALTILALLVLAARRR